MESACVSNERKILAGVKSSPLTDVFGALRLPLVPHVQTGSSYRCKQLSVMGCMPTTLSQDVHLKSHIFHGEPSQKAGLQMLCPLSMMDIQFRMSDEDYMRIGAEQETEAFKAPTCHRQEYSLGCLQMVKCWKFVIVMCP